MILIDSLYINNSGGKVLLDYLVKELEQSSDQYFYLFDHRCFNDFQSIPNSRKLFMQGSLIKRHRFYVKNRAKFSKIFCFGNLPPTISLDVPVFTYLQQRLFIDDIHLDFSMKQQVILKIKRWVFSKLITNSNLFIVQSKSMQNDFCSKYSFLNRDKVKIMPFYEEMQYPKNEKRIKNRFIYVSGGASHKNHTRLLQAFKEVYDKHRKGELVLTVAPNFSFLCVQIEDLVAQGYPIINLGFITKEDLAKEYMKAEYAVFPSLSESFGLGVIEGIEAGCKIIGADLPYLHSVCIPSLLFDPKNVADISVALAYALENELPVSQQIIDNNISSLIALINK